MRIPCAELVKGEAAGPVLHLERPISLWGGVDPVSGLVVDVRHPQRGRGVTAKVVVMPAGRGSSSSASALAEMVRRGTAPAALVCGRADAVLVVGATVAAELYSRTCPVVVADVPKWARFARLDGRGGIEIS